MSQASSQCWRWRLMLMDPHPLVIQTITYGLFICTETDMGSDRYLKGFLLDWSMATAEPWAVFTLYTKWDGSPSLNGNCTLFFWDRAPSPLRDASPSPCVWMSHYFPGCHICHFSVVLEVPHYLVWFTSLMLTIIKEKCFWTTNSHEILSQGPFCYIDKAIQDDSAKKHWRRESCHTNVLFHNFTYIFVLFLSQIKTRGNTYTLHPRQLLPYMCEMNPHALVSCNAGNKLSSKGPFDFVPWPTRILWPG